MNRPAMIHPDHLVDDARRGALAPDAWRRLGAHLAACPTCAWERAATDDFAREREARGDEFDQDHMNALVDGAMARAGVRRAPTAARHATDASAAKPGPRNLARWIGAAAMIAAAAAVLLPVARGAHEAPRDDSPIASTETGLDAGANGTPSGGDS